MNIDIDEFLKPKRHKIPKDEFSKTRLAFEINRIESNLKKKMLELYPNNTDYDMNELTIYYYEFFEQFFVSLLSHRMAIRPNYHQPIISSNMCPEIIPIPCETYKRKNNGK